MSETHGRKLASIRTISEISSIENADNLEIAKMHGLGWQVVVKKNEFHVGDRAVYFEIDSTIPFEKLLPEMEFLKDRCGRRFFNGKSPETSTVLVEVARIKTIKLRGQISQGLIIPAEALPFWKDISDKSSILDGRDMTSVFNVEVWDEFKSKMDVLTGKPIPVNQAGLFPSFVLKTDEVRLQSDTSIIEKYHDEWFEITEKFDGSSETIFYAPSFRKGKNPFGVCSRNFELKPSDDSPWFMIINGLEQKMKELYENQNSKWYHVELAIQGEHVGPGMNANRDKYMNHHLKVFRIWNITNQRFVIPDDRYDLCRILGLEHVKVISAREQVFHMCPTVDDFLMLVEGKTDHGHEREGMVFKSVSDGSISFKVINNKYLLKEKD